MVFAISYVHLGYVLHLLLFNESLLHYLSIVLPWWCFVFAWIITVLYCKCYRIFVQNYSCNYSCRNYFVKTTDFFYSVRMMALQYVVCIREMGRRWEMGFEIYVSLMSDLIWSVSLWLLLLCSGERNGCLTGELKVEWVQLASQLISVSFELCGGERIYIYYCSCWFLCHPNKMHSPKAILGHRTVSPDPHLLWTCERS